MFFVTFIVAFVLILLAAILFGRGLVILYQKRNVRARGIISTGFMFGLLGIVAAAIIFNVFNI